MVCEQLSEWLPDQWAGRLSDADRRALEAHLATCEACRADAAALSETWTALGALAAAEPSAALRGRFDAMLNAWQLEDAEHAGRGAGRESGELGGRADVVRGAEHAERVVPIPMTPRPSRGVTAPAPHVHTAWSRAWRPAMQIAAALLLIVGGFAAGRVWPGNAAQAALARTEITELRQEVRDMRQMVTLSLLQQQSATERLRGVSWSAQVDRPASAVLEALLDTLTHDANVNVRLASIEALAKFGQDTRVRRGLIDELGVNRQDSPLVQIAIIDALVEMKERQSVTALRTLAADQHANEPVRRRATWGIETLTRS